METLQAQLLKLTEIHADPNNPRKDYPKESLKELAASMKSFGVQQPLKVRTNPKGKGYLVVFGHRRQRAAELAELLEVPCFVEEMDELKAAKLQLTENIAREDLAPLEVAGALKRQMDLGVTIEQLVLETGKQKTTLYQHMQLLKLGAEGRRALGEEMISKSSAMEIATVPAQLQGQVLKQAGDHPTVHQIRRIIHERFRTALSRAHFDPADAELNKKAGACTSCPKRTGANPDLFATTKSPDVCTDTPCFDEKEAAWLKLQAKAGKKKVLSETQAKAAFAGAYGGDRPTYSSAYVRADEPQYEHSNKKAGALVEDEELFLAKAPNGAVVELVRKIDLPQPKGGGGGYEPRTKSAADVKRDHDHKVRSLTVKAAVTRFAETKAVKEGGDFFLRIMLEGFAKSIQQEPKRLLAKLLNIEFEAADEAEDKLLKHAGKLNGVGLRGFAIQLAVAEALQVFHYGSGYEDHFERVAEMLKVDLGKVEKEVREQIASAKKEKAKAKTPTTKKTPAKKPAIAAKAKGTPKKPAKKKAA